MATDDIVLSAVVMHHPARSAHLSRLLSACQPLPVRVISDPQPDGPPSPLRTAKRAWAAVAESATHHLVLQDDVLPVRGLAAHLHRAVAAQPDVGLTLSVHQKSPRNAYSARRVAVAGEAWAPMSVVEWTPTLGLVLPVPDARALATYFAGLPDELREDDDFVTPFCVTRGLPVFATIPNLVEHAGLPSLSGYEPEGRRADTVFDASWSIPEDHWSTPPGPLAQLVEDDAGSVTVELRESRCGLRFLRPGTAEPLEHPYTWCWRDWSVLLGVDARWIVAGWVAMLAEAGAGAARLLALGPVLTVEVWAAAFLLGALLPPGAGDLCAGGFAARVRRRTAESWLDVGLSATDRAALNPVEWAMLVDLMLCGVRAGVQFRTAPCGGEVGRADHVQRGL